MSINKVILVGNVGKDPEIRHLQGGASVATITLATSERYKDRSGETREMTEWHTVIAWRQLADLAENYIRKGSQLYVEGKIRSRSKATASRHKATASRPLPHTAAATQHRPSRRRTTLRSSSRPHPWSTPPT